jgi:DNA-binding NtrC family response regulator
MLTNIKKVVNIENPPHYSIIWVTNEGTVNNKNLCISGGMVDFHFAPLRVAKLEVNSK